MRFWACCEIRAKFNDDYRGYALLVDHGSQEVIRKYDIPTIFDANLEEGACGKYCRGIRAMRRVGRSIYVLSQGGIIELNPQTLTERRRLRSDYNMGGHCLVRDGNGSLWYNSPALDTIIRFNYKLRYATEAICMPNIPEIAEPLDLKTVDWDEKEYYRKDELWIARKKAFGLVDQLHLNTLQILDDGLYGFSCTHSALFRIKPDPELIHVFDDLEEPHDGTFVGEKFVINDSGHSRTIIYDHETFVRERVIDIPKRGRQDSGPKYLSGYVRGLLAVDERTVLIGTSPLSVYEIDILDGQILNSIVFSDNVTHTCHGLNRA